MRLFRLYTGDDGQAHIEQLSIPFTLEGVVERTALQGATGITFMRMQPSAGSGEWHPSPNRHYVINLAGAVEIGLGDGSVHRFGAGDVVLAEDTTGQGHTIRTVGDEPRIIAIVPLAH